MDRGQLQDLIMTRAGTAREMASRARTARGLRRVEAEKQARDMQAAVEVAGDILREERDDLRAEERIKALFLHVLGASSPRKRPQRRRGKVATPVRAPARVAAEAPIARSAASRTDVQIGDRVVAVGQYDDPRSRGIGVIVDRRPGWAGGPISWVVRFSSGEIHLHDDEIRRV